MPLILIGSNHGTMEAIVDTSSLIIIIATAKLLAVIAGCIVVAAGSRLYWRHRNEGGRKVITAFFILAAGLAPLFLALFLPQLPVEIMPTIPWKASELRYFTTLGYVAWALAGPAFGMCCYFLAARLLKRGPGEPAMPESSWLETFYFRRTPEGLIFTCPSPWMFGRGREYRVSDAQAGQLIAPIKRYGAAHVYGIVLTFLVVWTVATVTAAAVMMLTPERFFGEIALYFAILVTSLMLAVGLNARFYRAVRTVLAGVSWTRGEPFPIGNLKKIFVSMTTLPTPVLVIAVVVMGLDPLRTAVIRAYKALASGQVNLDAFFGAAIFLLMSVAFGAALVIRLRARRAAA